MKTKNKKDSVLRYILLSTFAFIFIFASLFAVCKFSNKNNNLVVKADSVVDDGFTFNGSKFPMLISNTAANSSNDIHTVYTYFTFSSDANSHLLSWNISLHFFNDFGLGFAFDSSLDIGLDYSSFTDTWFNPLIGKRFEFNNFAGTFFGHVYISSQSDGIPRMGKPVKFAIESGAQYGTMMSMIQYFDKDGNSLRLYLNFFKTPDFPQYDLYYREYYLTDDFNFTDNEYYNQGYTAGSSIGYGNGYNSGVTDGYNEGYSEGNRVGYQQGLSNGLANANDYSFFGLIGAVIDAPIQYLSSLFNFNILGFNMLAFITSLFTVCLIIWIVKMLLGGK